MNFSIGANAPTREELKTKLVETNAANGSLAPQAALDIANSTIDMLPEIQGTCTASLSGELAEDPAAPSRMTVAVANFPAAPPAP